jgi:hypothetical protein
MPAVPFRSVATRLAESCQPASLFPSAFRASTSLLAPFPTQQQTRQLQGTAQAAPIDFSSELKCSSLQHYPAACSALLKEHSTDFVTSASFEPTLEVSCTVPATPASAGESSCSTSILGRSSCKDTHSSGREAGLCPSQQCDAIKHSSGTKIRSGKQTDVSQETAPLTAASLLVQDYEMRLRNLERRCREMNVENLSLHARLKASLASQENSRELNLRLSKEVLSMRKQLAEITEVRETTSSVQDVEVQTMEELAFERYASPSLYPFELPPGLPLPDEKSGSETLCGGWQGFQLCDCSESINSWGCDQHQIYTGRLMLAHRDISLVIAEGAPGLERPVIDDLSCLKVQAVSTTEQAFRFNRSKAQMGKKHAHRRSRTSRKKLPVRDTL